MGIFKPGKTTPPQKKWKIAKDCLSFILESAKSVYPREFAGLLRVDDLRKDTIVELVLLPGTISGDHHAIFRLHMRPFDLSLVGTVHSHPSPFSQASNADLSLFSKYGKVHIIVASPFTFDSWQGYDAQGNKIIIEVLVP